MDILNSLLSNLINQESIEKLKPLIDLLSSKNFDLKTLLSQENLKAILPIIENIFSSFNEKSPTETVGQYHSLTPIAPFADREIVYSLNKYLAN